MVAPAETCGYLALPVPEDDHEKNSLFAVRPPLRALPRLPTGPVEGPPGAGAHRLLAELLPALHQSDGQVIIPEEGGGTISEAQAYALLRAVWANDATVFNRVYLWTYEKLSRGRAHGDRLLSWRWGRLPDGSWGVLDANSATDGDLDYALALVLAARKGWRAPSGLPDYREEARRVQADILAKEVVALPDGDLLLTPGNWHEPQPPYLVNPSYFSPAAYRLFARSDHRGEINLRNTGSTRRRGRWGIPPLQRDGRGGIHGSRPWSRLHQSTYKLLEQLTRA